MVNILRASEAGIWANCPGSTVLAKVAESNTDANREGDLLHALTSRDSAAIKKTGMVVIDAHRDMAEAAREYCESLAATGHPGQWETAFKDGSLPEGVRGTCDYFAFHGESRTLHVVDLKFGFGSVQAFENWQLLTYSIGAMDQMHGRSVEKIRLHIYQPRDYGSAEPYKIWELPLRDWKTWAAMLKGRVDYARAGTPAETGAWCRYCPSRIFCPAFKESSSHALESIRSSPEDTLLTPSAISAELEYLRRAEAIIKSARVAFEDFVISEIKSGRPVLGWQIGRTTGRRYWSASTEEIKAVAAMTGMELTEEKPISITAAWKNTKARPILETLVTKSEGSEKLVPFDGAATKEIFYD